MNKNIVKNSNKKFSGELIFACFILLVGVFALILSIDLWNKVEAPKLASAAALPLFVSAIWVLLSLYLIIKLLLKSSPANVSSAEDAHGSPEKTPIKEADAPPQKLIFKNRKVVNVTGTILACICYCLILADGTDFYFASACLLFGLICFLGQRPAKDAKKIAKFYALNLLITAVIIGLIYLIFTLGFGIKF